MEAIVNPCISEIARFRLSCRQDFYSELAKVTVESDSSRDAKIIGCDLARAICEAPTACHALLEKDPRTLDLRRREKIQCRQRFVEQDVPRVNYPVAMASNQQQCQRFINAIVRRDKAPRASVEPRLDPVMIGVARHKAGKPCAGIDEDHGPSP